MNKLFKSIVAASVGVAMAIGVGAGLGREASAVYAESVYYTLNPVAGSDNGYASAEDIEIDDITWNVTGNSTLVPWRIGGKNLTGVDRNVFSKTAMPGDITKVELVVGSASSVTVNSVQLKVGASSGAFTLDTVSKSFTANSTLTFTPSEGETWGTGRFYCFVFNVTIGGSNKYVEFKSAKFYTNAAAATYSVTYDANGGSGNMTDSNSPYTSGNPVSVMDNTFTRSGYAFNHWNTKADDSGTKYLEGDSFEINSPVVLYAQWDEIPNNLAGQSETINFGNSGNATSINSSSFTFKDDLNVAWAIKSVGTTSFSSQTDCSQIGSSNSPATSITFKTTNIGNDYKVSDFSIKVGGFSGTAGDVSLSVGNSVVSTGSLNETNDITISNSSVAIGSSLTITFSNIQKGIKVYYISYTLVSPNANSVTITGLPSTGSVYIGDTLDLGDTISVVASGSYSEDVTWDSDDETVATVDNLGVVTGVGEGTANVTVTSDDDSDISMTCSVTVETAPVPPTVSKTIAEVSGTTTNETVVLSLTLDQVITVSTNSGTNNGKIYDNGAEWRLYHSDNAVVTVSAAEGYLITSVTFTYTTADNGQLLYGETTLSSGKAVAVDSLHSAQFNVGSSSGSKGKVKVTAIAVNYIVDDTATAKDIVETKPSTASLSYNYNKVGDGVVDHLDRNSFEITGNTYADWSDVVDNSGVVYAGNSNASSSASIQLRSSDNSGIIVTANSSGKLAKRIIIKWNPSTASGRTIDVYGNDSAYTSTENLYGNIVGTFIDDLSYDGENVLQELAISGDYEYIGIRSNSGALYIDSILIQWGEITSYGYDDVAIRLGGSISKDLWTQLNTEFTIQGYGVLLSTKQKLNGAALKTKYDVATSEGPDFKKFDMALSTKAPVDGGTYYYWNLYKRVTSSLTTDYVAVAYIRLANDKVAFLEEIEASAKGLAAELIINKTYDLESFDGSLANLACLN